MTESIIAIDQSLSCCGVCVLNIKTGNALYTEAMHPPETVRDAMKLQFYGKHFHKLMEMYHAKVFCMERPAVPNSMSTSGRGTPMFLGTVFGVLQFVWVTHRNPKNLPYLIPASTVKAFASGKGNASKSLMLKCLYKTYDLEPEGFGADDIADAVFIGKITWHIITGAKVKYDYQQKALDGLDRSSIFSWWG